MRAQKGLLGPFRATSVSEFLKIVEEVRRAHFHFKPKEVWGPWFRGHQKAHWGLSPKLYRGGYDAFDKLSVVENEIREEFIVRAHSLSNEIPSNANKWEWYSLMQHHGAPTRLLDWTDGSLLGLYFAVKDNPGIYDAAVWMLDPYKLNEAIIHVDAVIAPGVCSAKDNLLVDPWLPDDFKKGTKLRRSPVAIIPAHIARRISSQRSCFTIHGADKDGLEKLSTLRRPCLVKIVIPGRNVQEIQKELEAGGIDEATIFPDLDGLGRCVSARWKPHRHKLPHVGVCTRLRPSQVHQGGVGVFAIKNVRKGEPIFPGDAEEAIQWVEKASFKNESRSVRKLYNDFAVIKGSRYGCPLNFNQLTPAWYINEPRKGQRPNVRCETVQAEYEFYALRNIKAGEELTVIYDYSDAPPTLNR